MEESNASSLARLYKLLRGVFAEEFRHRGRMPLPSCLGLVGRVLFGCEGDERVAGSLGLAVAGTHEEAAIRD